jgi:hypothetical protein
MQYNWPPSDRQIVLESRVTFSDLAYDLRLNDLSNQTQIKSAQELHVCSKKYSISLD